MGKGLRGTHVSDFFAVLCSTSHPLTINEEQSYIFLLLGGYFLLCRLDSLSIQEITVFNTGTGTKNIVPVIKRRWFFPDCWTFGCVPSPQITREFLKHGKWCCGNFDDPKKYVQQIFPTDYEPNLTNILRNKKKVITHLFGSIFHSPKCRKAIHDAGREYCTLNASVNNEETGNKYLCINQKSNRAFISTEETLSPPSHSFIRILKLKSNKLGMDDGGNKNLKTAG